MPYKKNVQPEDLIGAKIIGIMLTTPKRGKEGPIHRITLNMKGKVTHQESTPKWGDAFLTFPPTFKDSSAIAKWSWGLLEDCYGCGDVIEQHVCVLELYTHEEINDLLDKEMFEDIKKDLMERMSVITDSRQPTGDEVRIAWLVGKLEDLAYPLPESPTTQSQTFKNIENNLKERMKGYTDSRQPTNDERSIAWLLSEVDRLNEIIKPNKQRRISIAARKKELIIELAQFIYPTTQIMKGEIPLKKYIEDITKFLTNELLSRRISVKALSLFAELAEINEIEASIEVSAEDK